MLMTQELSQLKGFLGVVLFQPNIAGPRMTFHAFKAGNSGGNLTYSAAGAFRQALVGHRFDEFAHTQSARVACGASRWQDVVWPGTLVTICHRGFFTQEQ
jgi:hypothetical protein